MNTSRKFTLKKPGGMTGFTVICAGQLISVLTSSMSGFALSIWMFQKTGSATAMGAMQASFILPFMLITPFAGAMIDRYNRKLMMMVSDLAAVLATAGILVLQAAGQLQFWHLYVANVLYGLGNAFQWPAYCAAMSTMVPKEKLGKANGIMSLVESGPAVFAPILAGALLPFLGLTGILGLDVLTFLLAIGTLAFVHIPQPVKTVEGQAGKGTILKEIAFGYKYIFARPSLRAYLAVVLGINLVTGLADYSLIAPMLLTRTGQNSVIYGAVQTGMAVGGVAGGLIMSAWGGFKRRTLTMLSGWVIFALVGYIGFGMSRSPVFWIATSLIASMTFPMTSGAAQSVWQSKVAPDVQGRVFAARRTIALISGPITPLISGSLADRLTEPLMSAQTPFSQAAAWLVGSGPGSGMSLQFVFAGLLWLGVMVWAFMTPAFRNMETLLPDHDQMEKVPEAFQVEPVRLEAVGVEAAEVSA